MTYRMLTLLKPGKILYKKHTREELKATRLDEILRSFVSISIHTCLFLFGRDFVRTSPHLDDKSSGRYALHYNSSHERNFVTRIFVKRKTLHTSSRISVLMVR